MADETKSQQRIYDTDIDLIEAVRVARGLRSFADALNYVLERAITEDARNEIFDLAKQVTEVGPRAKQRIDELLSEDAEEGESVVAA